MIVNHKYKYIFVKTTKTAGTSMEIALSRSCDSDDIVTPFGAPDDNTYRESLNGYQNPCNYEQYDLEEHSRASVIAQSIPRRWWDTYTKIAILRDPVDYTISRYYWDNRSKLPRGIAPTIDEWVRNDSRKIWHNWRIHTIGNEPAMDFYIIYDRLAEDASILSNMLGLNYDLSEEVTSTSTKTQWRKKKDPIQEQRTYDFIRRKAAKEQKLIERVRRERMSNHG